MSIEYLEEIREIVANAFCTPSYAEFKRVLQEAGLGFAVRRCSPILLPEDRCGVRLVTLHLCRRFWLRFAAWTDGLHPWLEKRGPAGLCTLWRGTTGHALSRRSRRRVAALVRDHGPLSVADIMRRVVEESSGIHVDLDFGRFVGLSEAAPFRRSTVAWAPPAAARAAKAAQPSYGAPPGETPAIPAEALPQAMPEGQPAAPGPSPDLRTTVAAALREPWCWSFKGRMAGAGYRVTASGCECVLEPAGGGAAIPLAALGLQREYSLRLCEWIDGLAVARWQAPAEELAGLWSSLFAAPADDEVRRGIGEALKPLPPLAVAHAIYSTAWRRPELDAGEKLRYFWGVWLREAKRRRRGTGCAQPQAVTYPVPRDARPEYRGDRPRQRRRGSRPQMATQTGGDRQALG